MPHVPQGPRWFVVYTDFEVQMKSNYVCSFCGVSEFEAKKIVTKGTKDEPAICSECIVLCVSAMISVGQIFELVQGSTEKNPAKKNAIQGLIGMDISFPDAPGLGTS